MKDIEKKIFKIIYKITKKKYKLNRSTTLTNDILDSFNMIELIVELEKEFKIKLNQKDLNYKNYTNINKISNLIKKNVKRKKI
tara:strand:+ start:652 stop:900 length:249 start_codon:yes stop_codon:yes gene_type:complete